MDNNMDIFDWIKDENNYTIIEEWMKCQEIDIIKFSHIGSAIIISLFDNLNSIRLEIIIETNKILYIDDYKDRLKEMKPFIKSQIRDQYIDNILN